MVFMILSTFEHFLHFDYIEANFDHLKDSLGDLTFETSITILTIENLNSINHCYLTINCDTGQHSPFLWCFKSGNVTTEGGVTRSLEVVIICVMKYFVNNKIYSSLSDSKKVCISNILKTQGAKIVFTNLELLIEFKSKCFWSIRFWFVGKSIHVNLWILIWFDGA